MVNIPTNDATQIKRILADMKSNPSKYRLIFEAYRMLPDSKRKRIRKLPKYQKAKLKSLM